MKASTWLAPTVDPQYVPGKDTDGKDKRRKQGKPQTILVDDPRSQGNRHRPSVFTRASTVAGVASTADPQRDRDERKLERKNGKGADRADDQCFFQSHFLPIIPAPPPFPPWSVLLPEPLPVEKYLYSIDILARVWKTTVIFT